VSCNPAELKDPAVPPTFSGYPSHEHESWAAYWDEYRRVHAELHADFDEFCRERGAPPLPELEFVHTSPWLNLWIYPDQVDYRRSTPLDHTWHNLEASVRTTDAPWEPPAGDGPLVYLSLGSLASGDVELMRGLIGALADSRYRVVVSKGPQHEELELAGNMVGEEFLPQTSILPHVDAVITHGGNNTVTESLYFGKPLVLLPVFWDQYDNAQRMEETGFGIRLDTYGHAPEELATAVERLLADAELGERLGTVSRRLQAAPGTERAADLIEGLLSGAS
jgi:MGT family glycosyltransferase